MFFWENVVIEFLPSNINFVNFITKSLEYFIFSSRTTVMTRWMEMIEMMEMMEMIEIMDANGDSFLLQLQKNVFTMFSSSKVEFLFV